MSIEETCIKNIENGIRSLKLGVKKPDELKIGFHLNKLREYNEGMYSDYLIKYKEALTKYKSKRV